MVEVITSKNNQKIKDIRKLIESAKERRSKGLFVIEGLRLVAEAPEDATQAIYVSESFAAEDGQSAELKKRLLQAQGVAQSGIGSAHAPGSEGGGCRVETVTDDVFRTLSDTVNPQGILALVRQPSYTLDEVIEAQAPARGGKLFVILDDVRDPGNLGTIVRTAEAAGAAVIMSPGCADIFNPKVIRSTMGSIFRVPFAVADIGEAIGLLQERKILVCAAALDGSVPFDEVPYPGKAGANVSDDRHGTAFIIGNEANGVSTAAQEAADYRVRIPMCGKVESLNAAISAAVLMYHLA